jgi:phage I-like protein
MKRNRNSPALSLNLTVPEEACLIGGTGEPDFAWTDVEIIADGTVKMYDGSTAIVDAESAQVVIDDFNARGVKVPIDWDHSTVYNPAKGARAPAAGWIKGLKYEPGRGILASEIEWTEDGARDVHTKSYLYRSPVIFVDKVTNKVKRLHSVALTNKPLTLQASELQAASERLLAEELRPMADEPNPAPEEGAPSNAETLLMKLGQVIEKFDLKVEAGAGAEAVIDALLKKGGGGGEEESEVAASLRKLFELEEGADGAAILAAAEKAAAKAAQAGDLKALAERVAAFEAGEKKRAIDLAIEQWAKSDPPKINPRNDKHVKALRVMAEREWDGNKKLDEFHAFMETAPAVLPSSGRLSEPPEEAGTRREKLIAAAEREYREAGRAAVTGTVSWINGELTEHGLKPLTEGEVAKLEIA